ncbi:MAG: peptidylprolyl isomerase [Deltaproteobacteria bacterium]|nr:peptidylprolyl isomerase [Deltaproteobacteria bacterium]MBW2253802.1 peptidylprolyl isomerase [Deltaproteobacteria bacterium]
MRALALSLALFAFGCQPEPQTAPVPGHLDATGEVVATVNGAPITQDMIDAVSERFPPGQLERLQASGRYQEFLDRMAVQQLLYTEALNASVPEREGVPLALAMAQRDVLAAELLDKIADEAITDEKVAATYEEHAVQFKRASVKARHIVVKDLTLAEELKAQLEQGADFATLAQEHSTDPGSKAKGGDLGWFEKERMFREVSEAAFAAEKGALLGPLETRMGYHLVLVEDKRDKTPIEDVRPQLEQMIKKDVVEAYITQLQEGATIEWTDAEDDEESAGLEDEVTPPPADHP